ncbi:MAG: tetratricopeptide repeat protein [Bacteroidales bacterium]|nr:tetratricopeptide repeat protein [Bacteroidales bacterium]
MKKLNIIAIFILFFTLTACFKKKSDLYRKLENVDYLIRNNQRDSAESIFNALDMANAEGKEITLYKTIYVRLSGVYNYIVNIDSSYSFSERYFENKNDKAYLSEFYLNKSSYCIYKDMYDSAAYYLTKSEELATEIIDYYLLARIYWDKISFYLLMCDYENVKMCAELQLFYAEKSKNQRQIAYATLNKAIAYQTLSQNDSASIFLHAALLLDKYMKPKDIAFIYNSLGELTLDKAPNIAKDNFEKALKLYPNYQQAKINLAKVYLMNNDIPQAETLCDECLNSDWAENRIEVLKILCQCKFTQNNINEAFRIQEKIIAEQDSMGKRVEKTRVLPLEYYTSAKIETKVTNYWLYLFLLIGLVCIMLIIRNLTKLKIRKYNELQETLKNSLLKTNSLQELAYKQEKEIEHIQKENDEQSQCILQLEKQLRDEMQRNQNLKNSGESLYNQLVSNQPIISWTTSDMVNFIEYYRTLKPDFVETLDNDYKKLTPRYKIILVLEDMGKTIEEIMPIMSFGENAYYSAKSRINGAKK